MTWLKLDDNFFGDPKVVAAGRDARDLFLAALTYCSRHLTDGRIPAGALARIAADAEVNDALTLAERLVDVELWTRDGEDFVVPKFLKYNLSAEQIKAERDAAKRRKSRRAVGSGELRANSGRTNGRNPGSLSNAAAAAAASPIQSNPVRSLQQQPAAEAEALVDEFYETIGVASHGLTKSLRKRELIIAAQLVDAGAPPGEARRFVDWCRAGPFRPVPSDLRVYEAKRAQFLVGLEPVAASPPGRSNGSAHRDDAARADMARKFAHLGATP